ncbi:MAG: polyprenyl diphosphate synthase [Eubacteriales bacterium]
MKLFHKPEPVMCGDCLSHIAFIMDGNGRWAQKRGLPREAGHSAGAKNLRKIVTACRDRGIRTVTVYAFSTENWNRPKKEVDGIMSLLADYLDEAMRDKDKNKMRVRVLGDLKPLPEDLIWKICDLEEATAGFTDYTLNIALNYGGRQEITHAVNELIAKGVTEVTPEDISAALYTGGMPDPDLVVRTGGETRVSNFLLWQSAYAEYAFTKTPWPSFGERELDAILKDYCGRQRRYGGL